MSSQKRQKRWRHKVLEGLLADDSINKFGDHITTSDDLNNVLLHRKRTFERKVYKISKIEMKGENSTAKQKSASKNSDVSLTHRELIAEIDKSLKHLQSQKKCLQMSRRSNQDKTWSEELAANISLSPKREIQQKPASPISEMLAVLKKLTKEKQVADACTQFSFRKSEVKLANSSTQVGSSIQGSKRILGNKSSHGRHSSMTSNSKLVSPTITKKAHDLAKRSSSRPYGRPQFQNHQSPHSIKKQKYQIILTENYVQIENQSQKDENKVTYKRRTGKKVVETRKAIPKTSHNLPKPQPREEFAEHSLNISVEHSTSDSILDSKNFKPQRQTKAQVKSPKKIKNGSDWNVLNACQKSFSYSKISLRSESKTIKSDQVIPSAPTFGKNCQINSISATKRVESHHINIVEDFKSINSQNHFKQTLTTSKHILKHERPRWKNLKDSHITLQQSGHQSYDISRTRSEIVDKSLPNSTHRRSLDMVPSLIDDSTYTRPDNDNNKDYIILPYCFKPKENDLPTGTILRRSRDVYGQKLTAEDLENYNQYMKAVEKSVVKDVESFNEQNKTEDGTIQDTVPIPSPQIKTNERQNAKLMNHNRKSIPRRNRKSSVSVIGQTEKHNFNNKFRTSESRSQDKSRGSTKILERLNHYKSQQTSIRSESNHEHPSTTSISPRERRIDGIALDLWSDNKPEDMPTKLERRHERRVKSPKLPFKKSTNNLKLNHSDHHSLKDASPIPEFSHDLRSKASSGLDLSRRSESSLEKEAEIVTSPLKQGLYELSQLSRHNFKEIHSTSDPSNGRKIEKSLLKPENNYSLLNRFDSPKSNKSRGSTKILDRLNHYKSQQTSIRSESNHEHPSTTSISPRERRIDGIALDLWSDNKPEDMPTKLERRHERSVKPPKLPFKNSTNNLKLNQSDHHSLKDASPKPEFSHDFRSKISTSGSDYHKRTDLSRRSESSLEKETEIVTSRLKQGLYELSQLSGHDFKEIHSTSDPSNGHKIEKSLLKPENNYSLLNRFDSPKSKQTSDNSGSNQIRETGARRKSNDRKIQAISYKSDTEQDNMSRALLFSEKQRCFDSAARDANNEQGIELLKPSQRKNDSSSINSKSDRSEIQDISIRSEASQKRKGDVLTLNTFGSMLSPKEKNESRRLQSEKEWQNSAESKTTRKESYAGIKSESEQIEKQDIFYKIDTDNKLKARYTDQNLGFKQEQEDYDSSTSLHRRRTYSIINEMDNKIPQDTFQEPKLGLEQEQEKLPSETKLNFDARGHSSSQSQFTSINDALPESSAQHDIHETRHKPKSHFRSISQLFQEPKTIVPKTKSFTLKPMTADSEVFESQLHFKNRSSGIESEIIESSRLPEKSYFRSISQLFQETKTIVPKTKSFTLKPMTADSEVFESQLHFKNRSSGIESEIIESSRLPEKSHFRSTSQLFQEPKTIVPKTKSFTLKPMTADSEVFESQLHFKNRSSGIESEIIESSRLPEKSHFRSTSQLFQEPKTIVPKTKSFTLKPMTADSEVFESQLHFKNRSSGIESEIIESSRLPENDLNLKYEYPEIDLEYIDPQIKDVIQSLQKQLKNCNEFVKNQLVQYIAVAKENFKDTNIYKLDVKSTDDKLEPHNFEAEPAIEITSEQTESDEMELLSAEAQSSGDERCLCCPCCTCFVKGSSSRSSSLRDSSIHSEIPPFTGCDCMKEDYYKIMQIAYN